MKIDLSANSISIKVLFDDKEKVKEMGFKWNKEMKHWYRFDAKELSAVEVEYLKQLEADRVEELEANSGPDEGDGHDYY
jgi:uncharacterized pyridoxamine 5'-phosphate oxidase family protein